MLARDNEEHPVPPELHATFHKIADALAAGDYLLCDHVVAGVRAVDPATAKAIAESVWGYGDRLSSLHSSTWDHAVYRWMDGHWEMLVDLTTEHERVSDLTLYAKLHDTEPPTLEIKSLHVG